MMKLQIMNPIRKVAKLSLMCMLFLCIIRPSYSQSLSNDTSISTFIELNGGVAAIGKVEAVFPGASLLYGARFTNKNNLILEMEAGLAFPTIVTGKIGVGKQYDRLAVIGGVRPYPFTTYLQSDIALRDKGYVIFSFEFNPIGLDSEAIDIPLSFASIGNLNIGYRWNINRNK